jgi:hypothetical protein
MLSTVKSSSPQRVKFIRDVFVVALPSHAQVGQEIVPILEEILLSDWDVTTAKIVDVLARSRIAL